ncbi:MAG: hypothetical protein ACTHO8_02100, partial [Solirubrobacterales bacterium]
MARPGLPSLGGVASLPTDAVAALRKLPEIAESTRAMKEHTAALERVAAALDRVAADTDVLPAMSGDMEQVKEAASVLGPMDQRMAAIEGAM